MVATIISSGSSAVWLTQVRAESRSILIRIPEANGSGLYGRVKLIDLGDQTRVVVAIHGIDSGEFMPHIHAGSCTDYPGEPEFPLTNVTPVDRSRTIVELSLDQLLTGGYLVDIHWLAGTVDDLFNSATAVACTELGDNVAESPAIETEIAEPPPLDQPEIDDLHVTDAPVTGIGPLSDRYVSTMLVTMLASVAILFAAMGLDLRRRTALTISRRRLQALTRHRL